MRRVLRMVVVFIVLVAETVGTANGDQLYINFANGGGGVNISSLGIYHDSGASEGLDSYDTPFLQAPTPALDIYSRTTIAGHEQLSIDARPPESLCTITAEISGVGLGSANSNALVFSIEDALGEIIFATKNIFADLYTPADVLLGTYDVKSYAASGDTIPITINNGLSYKLDIRFAPAPEPSSLTLFGIAAGFVAFGWWRRRRLGLRTT